MSLDFSGPLFLVGMPRSGTKLLRNLLNRHPRVRIPEIETEFLPWLAQHVGGFGDLASIEGFRKLYSTIVRFPYFMYRTKEGSLVTMEDWFTACRQHDAAGIFEALIRLETGTAYGSGVIWGDKSPSYIDHLPLIASLYPEARFIHIVRDVRDYCLSINRAWGKNMRRAAQRWADSVDAARDAGQSLGSAYMELRYENLLLQTEHELRRCCQHIAVDFHRDMLSLDRPSENRGDAKGLAGIAANNSGKFLRAMHPTMLADIEAISGQTMVRCGYTLCHPARPAKRLGPLALKAAHVRDGCNLVLTTRKEMGLVGAIVFFARYFRATRGI